MFKKLNIEYLRWTIRALKYRFKVEKHEIHFMLQNLKEGQSTIDIGAHKGAYTYWMSKYVGKMGHVFAFEPQPILYKNLKSLIKISNITNVDLKMLALSSSKGDAAMVIPGKETSPSATIVGNKLEGSGKKILVKKSTLDDLFFNQNKIPIDFIKCDAEGHELEVLLGGEKLLQKDKPIITLECEARHCGEEKVKAVFSFLNKLNYNGFFFDGTSISSLDNFDIYEHQLKADKKIYVNNFFFIPR